MILNWIFLFWKSFVINNIFAIIMYEFQAAWRYIKFNWSDLHTFWGYLFLPSTTAHQNCIFKLHFRAENQHNNKKLEFNPFDLWPCSFTYLSIVWRRWQVRIIRCVQQLLSVKYSHSKMFLWHVSSKSNELSIELKLIDRYPHNR